MGKLLNLKLKVWRQDDAEDRGRFEAVSYTHLMLPTILRV